MFCTFKMKVKTLCKQTTKKRTPFQKNEARKKKPNEFNVEIF